MSDIRQRIRNALAILEAPKSREVHQIPRTVGLAMDALRGADQAIDELESELELVSAPDLDAAREVQRLRRELEAARATVARLQGELASTREELEIEKRIHTEE